MKETNRRKEDEMQPEYGLKSLRARRLGPERQRFGDMVRLETDVAQVFPSSKTVKEALRFLIRITKDNRPLLRERGSKYRRREKEE